MKIADGNHYVIENDGDVMVVVPFSHYGGFDCRRTRLQRRNDLDKEQFLKAHPVNEGGGELRRRVLDELRITQEQMNDAVQKARYETWNHKYLRKFVLDLQAKRT